MEERENCFKKERNCQTKRKEKAKNKFSCDICGKIVSSKQTLNEHLNIHNGMLPYFCSHYGCGLRFRQSSALSSHLRVHKTISRYLQEKIDVEFLKLTSILKSSFLMPEVLPTPEFYFSDDLINLPPIRQKDEFMSSK